MSSVFLRALTMDDLDLTYKWHSDPTLYQTLVGPYRFVSRSAEQKWLQKKVQYNDKEINLMICLEENALPIGMISVREIDWFTRCGYLAGIFISESDFRGKGYGEECLSLMIKHCFMDLGLNRLYAHILKDNQASLRVFEECGFVKEGILIQHAFKEGEFKDVILVGLCVDRYKKINNY